MMKRWLFIAAGNITVFIICLYAMMRGHMLQFKYALERMNMKVEDIRQIRKSNSMGHKNVIVGSSMQEIENAVTGRKFQGNVMRAAVKIREMEVLIEKPTCQLCNISLVAVTTTLKSQAESVYQLSRSGIKVIVVSDLGSSQFASNGIRNIIVLSLDAQRELYPKLFSIPVESFARKIFGYLHAIKLGACNIYDFDDDNILMDIQHLENVRSEKMMNAELALDSELNVVNPYLLYGTPTFVWPRGFPLEYLNSHKFPTLKPAQVSAVGVVQILQSLDPDVDAIWRLQYKRYLPFRWRPPKVLKENLMAISENRYSPFNSQSVLISHQLLAFSYLPHTVHGRVSDIWRSFIMQYLMKNMNLSVAFAAPIVEHRRNPHNYMADFQGEQQLYLQSGALVDYLSSRQLGSNRPELEYINILNDHYMRGYIEEGDVHSGVAWISTLNDIGSSIATSS